MTIAIAVKCNNGYVFGADGRIIRGDMISPNTCSKMEKWGHAKSPMHVMFAGSSGAINKVKKTNPTNVEQLAEAVTDLDDEEVAEFIVRYRQKVYIVDGFGGLVEVTNYASIGSGTEHGAALAHLLFGLQGKIRDTEQTCKDVAEYLFAVINVNPACGHPTEIKVFKND